MNRMLCIGIPLAGLFIATSASAQAAPGGSPDYDIRHEVVVHGTAAEVKVIPDWMGREGVNVMLRTKDAELIHVDTAPAAFLKMVDFTMAPGDDLEFTGAWSRISGQPVFLAHSVKKQKVTISVRGPDGLPIW
jgi:hypothetical protein